MRKKQRKRVVEMRKKVRRDSSGRVCFFFLPECFPFEKGETRDGDTAPPNQTERKRTYFSAKRQAYGLERAAFQTEIAL
ncbi:hypothetical protein [uncultured Desulfovibrio sp.]|uniref:hypothetical protein n=1 Tax=uncultured Desulfovibrio sp. TaxID=167968 RepID=UPI0026117DE1|nr:hypothetical protein [uncultured Desulfovibrio sp.]